jgi:hypothetical protein
LYSILKALKTGANVMVLTALALSLALVYGLPVRVNDVSLATASYGSLSMGAGGGCIHSVASGLIHSVEP